jgi:hypothetical protein
MVPAYHDAACAQQVVRANLFFDCCSKLCWLAAIFVNGQGICLVVDHDFHILHSLLCV